MAAVLHVARPFQDVGVLCSRDKLPPILTCRGHAGYRISFPFSQRNKPPIGRTLAYQAGISPLPSQGKEKVSGTFYALRHAWSTESSNIQFNGNAWKPC